MSGQPEERLSAERLAEIRALRDRIVRGDTLVGDLDDDSLVPAFDHLAAALDNAEAEIDALRSTIVDLEAERELTKAAWKADADRLRSEVAFWEDAWINLGNEILEGTPDEYDGDEDQGAIAVRYVRDLEARAAADTPKLQAAQRLIDEYDSDAPNWERRLDAAVEALAAAFTEEPEAPQPPIEPGRQVYTIWRSPDAAAPKETP